MRLMRTASTLVSDFQTNKLYYFEMYFAAATHTVTVESLRRYHAVCSLESVHNRQKNVGRCFSLIKKTTAQQLRVIKWEHSHRKMIKCKLNTEKEHNFCRYALVLCITDMNTKQFSVRPKHTSYGRTKLQMDSVAMFLLKTTDLYYWRHSNSKGIRLCSQQFSNWGKYWATEVFLGFYAYFFKQIWAGSYIFLPKSLQHEELAVFYACLGFLS